jgi:hypothetical protein
MALVSLGQDSATTGTQKNVTFGDKYTRQMLPLMYAAGGLDIKGGKAQAQYAQQKAQLDYQLAEGRMDQAQYESRLAALDAKSGRPTRSKVAQHEYALEGMTPLEYYPEQTYVEQDPYTLEAIADRAARAQSGGLTAPAEDYTRDVLEGRYLGANPYLDAMYSKAAGAVGDEFQRAVLPALEARFARAGGAGGAYLGQRGAAQEQLGSTRVSVAS